MHYTGTEKFVFNMATMMQLMGHNAKVVTYSYYEDRQYEKQAGDILIREFTYKGIPVVAFKCKKHFNNMNLLQDNSELELFSESLIKDESPDLIHFGHIMRVGEFIKSAKKLGIPYIITLTDYFFLCPKVTLLNSKGQTCNGPSNGESCARFCSEIQPEYIKRRLHQAQDMLGSAKKIISPSKFLGRMFEQEFSSKISIIHHGVSYSKIKRNERVYKEGSHITFGFAGTLQYHKGADILLESYRKVPSRNTSLKILGTGQNDYVKKLKGLAKGDDRIEFCGVFDQTQLGHIFNQIDVMIIPSIWYENYPLVLHEALACQIPVISSNIGGMAEKIKNGKYGFTFDVGKVEQLRKVLTMISAKPEILNKIKDNLKKVHIPTIEQEAYAYERLYKCI
ncbi:glycosyltransferase [Ammoniphilus sp. 3BR4]|uniref:glycosyltransferase n=1 Tax=Ammoniphilus sp. 3BR4 TaxID=3158265 RepID=UPI003467A603